MTELKFNDLGDIRQIAFTMLYKGQEIRVHIVHEILDDMGKLSGDLPYSERRNEYNLIFENNKDKIMEVAKREYDGSQQNPIYLKHADFY